MRNRWRLGSLLLVGLLVSSACTSSATPGVSSAEPSAAAPSVAASTAATVAPTAAATPAETATAAAPVTLEWWHWYNAEPAQTLMRTVADEFQTAHPHVTINMTVYDGEAFTQKIAAAMQSGTVPDIWVALGGGRLAEWVTSGMVKDITADVAPWISTINEGAATLYQVNGKQYGIPYDLGITGFWYNKDLFAQAGVNTPPATWDEFIEVCGKLKSAGITPIALGQQDTWPGMFWWAMLALRVAGPDALIAAASDGSVFGTEPFIEAGRQLKRLIDVEPFQKGFLGTPESTGAGSATGLMANGKAAMELMGQWQAAEYAGLSADGKGLGDKLGWFPFPAVAGGAGLPTDAFGGGNGWSVAADAPPEAVEFLKYFSSLDVANRWGSNNLGLPVVVGSESSVTDPNMAQLLEARKSATYVQLYLDEYYAPAVGAAISDNVAQLFAGTATPEEVAQGIATEATR